MSECQFTQATQADLEAIVMMMADDELGKLREDDTLPLKESYQAVFEHINTNPNAKLIVVKDADALTCWV